VLDSHEGRQQHGARREGGDGRSVDRPPGSSSPAEVLLAAIALKTPKAFGRHRSNVGVVYSVSAGGRGALTSWLITNASAAARPFLTTQVARDSRSGGC